MQELTLQQLDQGVRNAYAAGDMEAAKRFLFTLNERKAKASTEADGPFEGFGKAFQYGIDAPLENMGTTAQALGVEGLGEALKSATQAPENYTSASSQFIADPISNWQYIPKAVTEQAGQFAGSIASRGAGVGIGGAVSGPVGAIAGGIAAPALFEGVQQLGPIALERAQNSGRSTPNGDDWLWASGTAAGSGALNAIAPNFSGIFKRMITEGGTEAVQSILQQGGATAQTDAGLEISPREAIAEGIIGTGSAGAVDIPIRAATGGVKSLFNRDGTVADPQSLDSRSQQAAGTLANRLQKIAVEGDENGKPYNLNDIDAMSNHGARAAVDAAHVQIAEEVKDKEKDLSEFIKPKDGDSADIKAKKVSAKVALRMTKNKTKSVVTKGDYNALSDLVGHTKQGQELLNLIAESQAATSAHNSGYKGGLSRFTDQFAPWGSTTGYSPTAAMTESAVRPLVSLATGTATGGVSFAGQLGALVTGRAVDAVTGRRSKVARFVRKNAGKFGLPEATGLDLKKEKALTDQQARDQRLAIGRVGTALNAAKPGPLQNIMLGTGLDRQGLIDVIKKMAKDFKNEPEFTDVLGQIESNLKGEGNRIDALTEVIPVLGAYAQQNAPELIKYMPDNPGLAREWANETQPAQPQRSPNYESGKTDNQKILADLRSSLSKDKSVSPNDKGILLTALADLEVNLGTNPVDRVNKIVDKVKAAKVPQKHIDKYIMPYVERVIQQQT